MRTACSSCRTNITNISGSVKFKCPNCGKEEIVRCPRCRKREIKYRCSSCGFEGPN